MAGQLITQVFKYRYILKEHVTDSDDQQVITGYYQHFQVMLGIVLCMLGFNVFNVIFQIYLTISVKRNEWGRQYELAIVTGAVMHSFQEGILLFGICLSLQVSNYFTRKHFYFRRICVAILVRMVYIVLFKCISVISPDLITDVHVSLRTTLALFCLNGIDVITRVFSVFAFIRMCLIVVNNHIKEFTNHINTMFLDTQRYEDKIKAYKLMKIAAWGTYSLAIFHLLDLLCDIAVLPYTLMTIETSTVIWLTSAGGIIETILSILPTILFSIFLLLLWTFFRHRTRVKYSGYRTMDVDRSRLFAEESLFTNQDNLHHIYYKHKNRVQLTSYVVMIVLVSSLFTIFLTPLMIERTQEIVTLQPGDYHVLGDSLRNCEIINYSFAKDRRIPPIFHGSTEHIECSEHLKGVKFEIPQMQIVTNIFNLTDYKAVAWIPHNSTIKYFKPPDNGTFTIKDLKVFSSGRRCPTPDYISIIYCITNSKLMSAGGNNYSIQKSGIYEIFPPFKYEPIGSVLINISRSMYQTTREVSYSQFTQNNVITQLDAIVYEYPHIVNVTKDYPVNYCELNIVCYFSPIWSILFGIAVFIVSMFVDVLLLYLIHKKR